MRSAFAAKNENPIFDIVPELKAVKGRRFAFLHMHD